MHADGGRVVEAAVLNDRVKRHVDAKRMVRTIVLVSKRHVNIVAR